MNQIMKTGFFGGGGSDAGGAISGAAYLHTIGKTNGQKFQKVENDENRFFAITSSKLFKN